MMEYKIVTTEHSATQGKKQLEEELNEAAADGWRYAGTMSTSRWGTTEQFAATVLMYRESVPKSVRRLQSGTEQQ